jgi:hypothetical protein
MQPEAHLLKFLRFKYQILKRMRTLKHKKHLLIHDLPTEGAHVLHIVTQGLIPGDFFYSVF